MKKAALLLVMLIQAAAAQNLPDPTRPPERLIAPPSGHTASEARLPQLQSVLVAREAGGRRIAVIDGQTVAVGGSFRGSKVLRISGAEVELAAPGGARTVLRLYPLPGRGVVSKPITSHQ
ncbi:MAG: hypothetical protein ACJ8HI_09070 [Massilia sp.]